MGGSWRQDAFEQRVYATTMAGILHDICSGMVGHGFSAWVVIGPKLLVKERMDFILYTRTYSIKKARERLGFTPWMDQRTAVQQSVDWVLKGQSHSPIVTKLE